MAGSGITHSIYDRINVAYDGITRTELIKSLGLKPDQVRCRTNDLVRDGRVEVRTDEYGVSRYYPATQKAKAPEQPVNKPTYLVNNTPTTSTKAWDTLVHEAELRGFAKGYSAGLKENSRQAYEDGKVAVLDKLKAFLL